MKKLLAKIILSLFGNKSLLKLKKLYIYLVPRSLDKQEERYFKLIRSYISSKSIVFDIGANIGGWSERIAPIIGKEGTLFAFEPIPESYEILVKKMRDFNQVQVINKAVSNKNGSNIISFGATSFAPPEAAIIDTADQFQGKGNLKSMKIETIRLDDFYRNSSSSLQPVSFMKIDVEGHELNVVEGAESIIDRFKPTIFMEILREKWVDEKPEKSEVAEFLSKKGYKISQLQYEKIAEIADFDPNFENFLFVTQT